MAKKKTVKKEVAPKPEKVTGGYFDQPFFKQPFFKSKHFDNPFYKARKK